MNLTAGTTGHSQDGSHRWLLTSVLLYTSLIPATFLWAPALATELTATLGLAPTRIGTMFLVELVFVSLATILAFFWLNSANLHRWGLLFIVGYIVGNLLSGGLLAWSFDGFLIARGLTATASGSLLILCTHSMRRLPDRGRGFGAMVFAQLILGSIGIAALPMAFRNFGPGVFFTLQAILMASCVPLYRHLAHQTHETLPKTTLLDGLKQYSTSFSGYGLLGMLSILLLYACLGGIWTFLGALQEPTGMSRDLFDQLLAVSSIAGIFGAGAATLLGGRERYRSPCLLLGYAALVMCLVVMVLVPQISAAYAAVLVFKFTWTLLAPFMLTVISLHDDHRGGLINLTNLVLGLGVGSSPAICGWLLESFNYKVMFGFGAMLALLAAIAINLSNFGLKKRQPISARQAPASL